MKKLNFGCRGDLKNGWDNVDAQKSSKLTRSFNFNKFPYPIKNNTYEQVYANEVLEHLEEPDKVLDELWRICKNKAIIEIIVPHYTNKGAYSNIQHKHFFNEFAFKSLEERKTAINKQKKFKIISLEMTPTIAGKLLPRFLREKLALFINGLISQIHVKLEVLK